MTAGLIGTMSSDSGSTDDAEIRPEVQQVADRIRSGDLTVDEDNAIFDARQAAEEAAEETREAAERKRKRIEAGRTEHRQQDVNLWEVRQVGERSPAHGGPAYVRCDFRFEVGERSFPCCRPVHRGGRHAHCDGVVIEAIAGVPQIYDYNDGDERMIEATVDGDSITYRFPFSGSRSGWSALDKMTLQAVVTGDPGSPTVGVSTRNPSDTDYIASLGGDVWLRRAASGLLEDLIALLDQEGEDSWREILAHATKTGRFL